MWQQSSKPHRKLVIKSVHNWSGNRKKLTGQKTSKNINRYNDNDNYYDDAVLCITVPCPRTRKLSHVIKQEQDFSVLSLLLSTSNVLMSLLLRMWFVLFTVAGPSTWNSLPDSLREQALSLSIFRRHLKTHFFAKYWRDAHRALDIFYEKCYINLHFTC